jgi:hypothetical protein
VKKYKTTKIPMIIKTIKKIQNETCIFCKINVIIDVVTSIRDKTWKYINNNTV